MIYKRIYLFVVVAFVSVFCHGALPVDLPSIVPENYRTTQTDDEEDVYLLLVSQAETAIKNGDYPAAADRLVDAMSVRPDEPTNVLLLSNLGHVYTRMGLDSMALQSFDAALRRAPAMTAVRLGRARVLLMMQRDEEARDEFQRVVERDSLNTDARYYHGMLSLYSGRLDDAIRDFEVLKSVAPKALDTSIAMATLYTRTGRPRDAIDYYRDIVARDPSPEYYAGLAGCYLNIGYLNEASEILTEALEMYPGDPELLYYRAWLSRDRYRLDDAHADAAAAIRAGADPQRVRALFEQPSKKKK